MKWLKNKQGANKGNVKIVRNLEGECICNRRVSYGYELDIQGRSYYLFIGEKKTFTYCDFLYKGNIQTLPEESSLIKYGFERRTTRRDCYLVYKFPRKTIITKSEGEAFLESIKDILF